MTDFRFSGGRKTNGPLIHALTVHALRNVIPNLAENFVFLQQKLDM